MKTLRALAACLPMIVPASTAMAGGDSYSGNWKVKLTHVMQVTNDGYRPGPDSTHCVALTDDGSGGRPHSGGVLVDGTYSGQFQVTGRLILVSVGVPGGQGEDSIWEFSSTASAGNIARDGLFGDVLGGESFAVANAVFGAKGGC